MFVEAKRGFFIDGRQVAVGEVTEVDSIMGHTLIAMQKAIAVDGMPKRRRSPRKAGEDR